MISNDSRDRIKGVFEPIALALGRLGLSPDALTIVGFAITVFGAVLLAQEQWLAGGLVVLVGGVFDMLDGTLARVTGRVSRWGAFLDSTLDKTGEIVVYLGIIAGLQSVGIADGPLLAAAALGASLMVSYTRARSEGLGFTTGAGMAAIGIMPREVRLAVLSVGLILAGILGTRPYFVDGSSGAGGMAVPIGASVLFLALGIIAVGATLTTIQRILHVRSQANQPATGRPTEQEYP
ncbi:MAG TPA: CDP-alcohol phosphatidyltransferase family protein [Candidatus Limnocylindrales bacterium]|nr:CDP-alcohol phosphatidyltransferase family protein [Candidatus Limnocylindrales bacterium]